MTSGEGTLGIADQNAPLNKEERQRFLESLDRGELLDELIGRGLLYTGVTSATFAHIRPGWLREQSGRATLFVPGHGVECDMGNRQGLYPGVRGEGPCSYCVDNNDGIWEPLRYENRSIPIGDERTQEVFRAWFNLHDRVAGQQMIYKRVAQRYADWCGIERLSPRVLRHTFAVVLVEKRFPKEIAVELLGFSGSWSGPVKYRAYGEYADGENPFLCGAPKTRGGTCQEHVTSIDGRCWRHEDV
jgi:integrase